MVLLPEVSPRGQAQHGGLPCKDETEAVQDCEDAPCPVHCELSDWTNEGDCSATCGGGEQKQIRTITTDADHGGEKCDTNREQTVPCETQVQCCNQAGYQLC